MLNRTDPPNTFVAFEGSHFLQYLDYRGYPDVWPKIRQVAAVLEGLVREARLSKLPGSSVTPGLSGSFMTITPPTALQRDGDLWLAPVLGPLLVIPRVGGATIPISGTSHVSGNATIGSGVALDGEHILTAAHVVNDMKIDDDLKRPAVDSSVDANAHPAGDLHVEAVEAHKAIDVAIVRVSGANGAQMDAADGLAWRDPTWSDELTIFGYPNVPTSLGAYLTVQRGEVVNPRIRNTAGETFLFSTIARSGNSGGPIIGRDGRRFGIVTHEPNASTATHDHAEHSDDEPQSHEQADLTTAPKKPKEVPLYAGIPSTVQNVGVAAGGHTATMLSMAADLSGIARRALPRLATRRLTPSEVPDRKSSYGTLARQTRAYPSICASWIAAPRHTDGSVCGRPARRPLRTRCRPIATTSTWRTARSARDGCIQSAVGRCAPTSVLAVSLSRTCGRVLAPGRGWTAMTTRELATLIWLGVVLLLCLVGRSTRHTLADLGEAILNIKIAAPLVSYAAVVVAATWLAWRLGYWDANLLGAVLLWFLFTGFKYFLQSTDAGKEVRFFRKRVVEVISVGALYELFLNIRTFSLWVEIVLQFVVVLVVMLRVVAQSNEEWKSASKFLTGVFALIVVWLLVSTAVNLGDHWEDIEPHDVLALFLVPVWLTAVTLPLVYIVALAAGYGLAFVRMSFACDDSPLSWKARAGVARELRGRLRDIDQFVAPWTWQAGKARTFSGARQIVKEFKAAGAADAVAAAAAEQRLVDNAGLTGTDEDGRQLDQREFKETRDALQWLATCQMGWYQREEDGGRYREDLLEILGNDFTKNGLPPKHGIIMRVAPDGQAWCALRRTVTGWVFAIGASEQPPSQWLYDGADPVRGFPGRHKSWGGSMFKISNANW